MLSLSLSLSLSVLRLNDINGTETPCARLEAAFQFSGAPDAVLYFPYVH